MPCLISVGLPLGIGLICLVQNGDQAWTVMAISLTPYVVAKYQPSGRHILSYVE